MTKKEIEDLLQKTELEVIYLTSKNKELESKNIELQTKICNGNDLLINKLQEQNKELELLRIIKKQAEFIIRKIN